jgi:hypothetical protein
MAVPVAPRLSLYFCRYPMPKSTCLFAKSTSTESILSVRKVGDGAANLGCSVPGSCGTEGAGVSAVRQFLKHPRCSVWALRALLYLSVQWAPLLCVVWAGTLSWSSTADRPRCLPKRRLWCSRVGTPSSRRCGRRASASSSGPKSSRNAFIMSQLGGSRPRPNETFSFEATFDRQAMGPSPSERAHSGLLMT